MENYFTRSAEGEDLHFIPIDRPCSNFKFIEKNFAEGLGDGEFWPLRRILSQVRIHEGKTIAIERITNAIELQEENEDIKKICPKFINSDSQCFRLSFFSTPLNDDTFNITTISNDAFIGYAIIKKDIIPATRRLFKKREVICRVYESVIKPSKHVNNYIKGSQTWDCRVGRYVFGVTGYLYAQQNAITNSCAHVALKTVISRFTDKEVSYRQINQYVERYRSLNNIKQYLPREGLEPDEIKDVLNNYKVKTFDWSYLSADNIPYQNYLYGSIESGLPSLVFFGFEKQEISRKLPVYHVIPIFGHTFNEDAWVADANFMYFPFRQVTGVLTSANWTSMFIGHDDNAGSNYCIPQHYLESMRWCSRMNKENILKMCLCFALKKKIHDKRLKCQQQKGWVAYAIGTLPESVNVNPIQAEGQAAYFMKPLLKKLLKNKKIVCKEWLNRLDRFHKNKLVVLRSILIKGSEYKEHLQKIRTWENEDVQIPPWFLKSIELISDEYIWMVEISIPELFSANRRKIGEIILRASDLFEPDSFKAFYCARLPGCFAMIDDEDNQQGRIDPEGPQFFFEPTNFYDHVELYNCEEVDA